MNTSTGGNGGLSLRTIRRQRVQNPATQTGIHRPTPLLTRTQEIEATAVSNALHAALSNHLVHPMRMTVIGMGFGAEIERNPYDPHQLFKILLREKKKNKLTFLPGLSLAKLNLAFQGRNQPAHNNLADVLKNWRRYVSAWIEFANKLGAPEAAVSLSQEFGIPNSV